MLIPHYITTWDCSGFHEYGHAEATAQMHRLSAVAKVLHPKHAIFTSVDTLASNLNTSTHPYTPYLNPIAVVFPRVT